MTSPTLEVVVKNSCSTVGESPHWEESSQSLLYVDVRSLDVHRWNSYTGEDSKIHLKDTVNFVIPRRHGGYVVGLGRRVSLLEWDTGSVTYIGEVDSDTGNRLNDAKCDAKGRVWTGTMGFIPYPPHPPMGSLYSLDLDRTLTKHISGIHISNGLAWSGDNRTMFYIDTPPRKVYAFNFDLQSGTISNQRVAVDYNALSPGVRGNPDGMTIDTEDKLWVAGVRGGQVCRFDPETGKLLQRIDFPTSDITSLCWGGRNLDELYVTSALISKPEEYFRQHEPLAGSVFRVTGLGVKGRPAFIYEG